MRLGVTGHMKLSPITFQLIYQAIQDVLADLPAGELIGVSCLAAGADSIFARAVLNAGGQLEVVLPSVDYRQAKVKPDHTEQFDELISQAASVRTMPYQHAGRDAYEAANQTLVSSCDQLLAVWDGGASGGRGGTADVVELARSRGRPVVIIWPDGAKRV